MDRPKIEFWIWVYLISCSMVGAAIVMFATSRYGMGVSSDSMFYISSADNFLAGNGFVDFKNDPLTDFPPLYSFILAIARGISGVTPFVWARFINAVVMFLIIASTAFMLLQAFPEQRLWFILGTFATMLFYPLYKLSANVGTDPIYILFSVWFGLAASVYLETHSKSSLMVMILLSASASMLRWVGIAFIVSLFLLVLYSHRNNLRRQWWVTAISGLLASLPVMLWVGIRNYYMIGTSGPIGHFPESIDELKNIELTISRIMGWATPYPVVFCLGMTIIFLVPILSLSKSTDWRRLLYKLGGHAILPMLLLSSVYIVAVIFNSRTSDHLNTWDDRYQTPLYIFMLLIFFAGIEELLLPRLSSLMRTFAYVGVVSAFMIWSGFQAVNIVRFIQIAQEQGVSVYNDYNNRQMLRSNLVVYLIKNPLSPKATLYSNIPEAVYFFLQRPVKMAPWDPENYTATPENLIKYYNGWVPEEEAYLIFFKPNYKRHHYNPDEIDNVVELEKLFNDWQGSLYKMRPKE